jgi:hypothetical protein
MMGNPYYDDEKVKERIIRTIPAANVYYKYLDRTTGIPQTK